MLRHSREYTFYVNRKNKGKHTKSFRHKCFFCKGPWYTKSDRRFNWEHHVIDRYGTVDPRRYRYTPGHTC